MRSRLEIALLLLSFFLLDLRPARKKSKSDHAGCQPAHEEKERKNGKEEGEIWKLHAACILLFVFTTWLLSWWLIISLLLLLLFRLFHLSLLWVYPLSQRFARDYYFLFYVFLFFPPLFGESLHAMKCLFPMMLFTSRGRSLFAALGIEPSQIQMGKREITTTNNTGGIENRERPEPNLHDRIPDPHFSIGAFPIWKAIRSTVREPSSAAIDHCFYIGRKIRQCLIHHRYPQCVCDAICMDCR